MNEYAAKVELTGRPLIFGDEQQIAARKYLEQVGLCEDALYSCLCRRNCTECDGAGEVECSECGHTEAECEHCGGTGIAKCRHTDPFTYDVIADARRRFKNAR